MPPVRVTRKRSKLEVQKQEELNDLKRSSLRRSSRNHGTPKSTQLLMKPRRVSRQFNLRLRKQVVEFLEYLDKNREAKKTFGVYKSAAWQTAILTFLNDVKGNNVTHKELQCWMRYYPKAFQNRDQKFPKRLGEENEDEEKAKSSSDAENSTMRDGDTNGTNEKTDELESNDIQSISLEGQQDVVGNQAVEQLLQVPPSESNATGQREVSVEEDEVQVIAHTRPQPRTPLFLGFKRPPSQRENTQARIPIQKAEPAPRKFYQFFSLFNSSPGTATATSVSVVQFKSAGPSGM